MATTDTGIIWSGTSGRMQVGTRVWTDYFDTNSGAVTVHVDFFYRVINWSYNDSQVQHHKDPSTNGAELSPGFLNNKGSGDYFHFRRDYVQALYYDRSDSHYITTRISGAYDGSAPSLGFWWTAPRRPSTVPAKTGVYADFVGSTTARVGATYNGDGGSPITEVYIDVSVSSTFNGFFNRAGWGPHHLTGLAAATVYYVRSVAKNANGFGPYSDTIAFTTGATVPSAPAAPTVSAIGQDTAQVAWNAPGNGGSAISNYEIQVDVDSAFSAPKTVSDTTSPNDLASLLPGSDHWTRVRAINAVGAGGWSAATKFTTLVGTPVIVHPQEGLAATRGWSFAILEALGITSTRTLRVQFSKSSTFASGIFEATLSPSGKTGDNRYTVADETDKLTNGTWYARANVTNTATGFVTPWSPTRTFTISHTPAATGSEPAAGSTPQYSGTLARTNLCDNPNVEVDLIGWNSNNTANYTVARDTGVDRIAGVASAKMATVTSSTVQSSSYVQGRAGLSALKVKGGVSYAARFAVRSKAANRRAEVRLVFRNAANAVVGTSPISQTVLTSGVVTTTGAAIMVAPATADSVIAIIDIVATDGVAVPVGELAYADHCLIEEATTAQPYFDGSSVKDGTLYHAWTGEAHKSSSQKYSSSIAFKFQFIDPSSVDRMSAYQLVVENNATGALVYDTTKKLLTGTANPEIVSVVGDAIPPTNKGVGLRWRVKAWDRDNQESAWSGYSTFTLADPPAVSITAPANSSTVDNGSPTFTWAVTIPSGGTQASAVVEVFDSVTNVLIWTTTIAGAGKSATPPVLILTNGKSYYVTVTVKDSTGLTGKATSTFTASYSAPPAVQYTFDGSSADLLGYVNTDWSISDADPLFVGWKVYRVDLSDPTSDWTMIYETTDQNVRKYRDYLVVAGKTYSYSVTQTAYRSGVSLESTVGYYRTSTGTVLIEDRFFTLNLSSYWLIDSFDLTNSVRIPNVTSDDNTLEFESESFNIIGRGRHRDYGDELGYTGSLTCQVRVPERPSTFRARIEEMRRQSTTYYLRTPFGRLITVALGDIGWTPIAGTGTSEMGDMTIPYEQVS